MEREFLHTAFENLEHLTGLAVHWEVKAPLDATVQIDGPKKRIQFIVQFKKEVRPHQVNQLEHYNATYKNFMIVANRIFPKVKEELRILGIAYLETNGNVYIKNDDIFLFIDTQKPVNQYREKGNRAFTKTGLKVLLHLLQNKEDINLPQREMARITNVGLGTIPQVIEGLKNTGYLLQLNKKQYVWEKRKELLERWIAEYDTVLKPKLRKDRYHYEGNWKEIEFTKELTVWGGEPAADILTNYLRPANLILYTKENRLNLMKNYRLIPKKDGEIEVFELFWTQDENKPTAPEVLVYAELMLEGGKRNKETAQKIYDEYIEPKL